MSTASLALHTIVFTFTMWLGLYLMARAPHNKKLLYAGLGLTAYAESLLVSALSSLSASAFLTSIQWSLIFFPAVFWTAT